MKRSVYLLHRWLGVALGLPMLLWFVSGLVMLYVGYPKLTLEERLTALPALDVAHCTLEAASVVDLSPESLRLTRVAGAPRLIAQTAERTQRAFDATNGQPIAAVDEGAAMAAARAFSEKLAPGDAALPLRYEGAINEDAWTHSRALDAHRPLHRVYAGSTLLYVSSQTGEIVRDARATERYWGWLGTWLHWLYMFRGGALDGAWTDIIIYASLIATALTMLGMLVGVWRWRFTKPYRSGSRSPYRKFWLRWHHVAGLVFGATALTFIFSGLMSMNPFKVFGRPPPDWQARQLAATRIDAARFALPPCEALQRFSASGFTAHELEWRMVQGQGYYLARDAQNHTRLLAAAAERADEAPFTAFNWTELAAWGRTLGPAGAKAQAEVLQAEELYYYRRVSHSMTGGYERPLPALRMRFDDPQATWIDLDPASGAVVQRLDQGRRASRWLFAFLHSWDAPGLLALRPLWDAWMWLLSLGGLVISATGVVIGIRRLAGKPHRREA